MYSAPISARAAGTAAAGWDTRGAVRAAAATRQPLVLRVNPGQLLGDAIQELVHLALVVPAQAGLAAEDLLLDVQRRHPLLGCLLDLGHVALFLLLPHLTVPSPRTRRFDRSFLPVPGRNLNLPGHPA
jgi:hypothetical protein